VTAAGRGGIYVGLGSNLGDPPAQLKRALQLLREDPAIAVLRASRAYRTPPWGNPDQPPFVNAVAELDTTLGPLALMQRLLAGERRMGRVRSVRSVRWGPREIDLDLLVYRDQRVDEPGCHVPHPHLAERAFVLVPLHELAPTLDVPGAGPVARLVEALAPAERAAVVALPGVLVERASSSE
jgi:2-amino-4-hydroxy-6-hydroxymethyldihydropteridine diphosphokinase